MLAIIIPYYKLTFFEDTLASLATQTDKRFKVYIGDDASPENPTALIDKYRGKFDFKYHRFDENLGGVSLTKQWERCIELSGDEEWLMILGDDDVLGKNVVEEFYKTFLIAGNKVNLFRFNLRVIDEKNALLHVNEALQEIDSSYDLLEKIFLLKEIITMSEFVFTRKIYEQNNGIVAFPLAWFSDYATWLLYGKKTGIFNINNASVYWRLSKVNISSKSTDIKEIELKVTSLFLFNSFLKDNLNIDKEELNKYQFNYLLNQLNVIKFFSALRLILVVMIRLRKKDIIIVLYKYIGRKVSRKIFN
ncbi:glycosyltransferase family 2 protein [Flavobacterium daejeonense]|uniref:glycosyltransferase family 2 protein n=1 Tax=Flavobacterium daejeonense TaxID=350893 RepID=UPI000691DFD2|nr:glycosyltransferase [Flavobacterium daejeonense]